MAKEPSVDDALSWLASSKGFKLGRGVVGKTGQVVLGLMVLWGMLIIKMTENLYFDAALAAVGLLITLFVVWFVRSTQSFAEANPAQALLEGAEIVAYKQIEADMATAGTPPGGIKRVGATQELLPPSDTNDAE